MDFSPFGVQEHQMLEFCVFFLVYSKIQEPLALLNHQTDESECQDAFLILPGAFSSFKKQTVCFFLQSFLYTQTLVIDSGHRKSDTETKLIAYKHTWICLFTLYMYILS